MFTDHHESHAASAFFPSPFDEAAILTIDGVGEWSTTCFGVGRGNKIELTDEIALSALARIALFGVHLLHRFSRQQRRIQGDGSGTLRRSRIYKQLILEHLLDLKEDGSFRMDMSYFNYCQGLTMTSRKFHELFGGPPRRSGIGDHAARDGSGRVGPGGDRRDHVADGAACASARRA